MAAPLALALALALGTQSPAAALFEGKCGYCHSTARATDRLLTRPQWKKLVKQMQARAPLLISRSEVDALVRYLVNDLKLVPPEPPPRRVLTVPPLLVAPRPEAVAPPAEPGVESVEPPPEPEDLEAEQQGPQLLADRCSKCHTLNRVFTKVDSLAAGEAIINRMRKKTGSGISPDDAGILLRFLASRAGR